ncbi:MAG: polysaccharide biosynthesis tyrosine autokinase [Firmicutes bacterium]|nr:polysaccharide biosynthesis tyrosine autokinase [Bacillota bacterium]
MENTAKKEKNLTQRTEEFEIDLQRLFTALMRKLWVIVAASLIAGLLSFGYTSLFVTPMYKSAAMFYVNNGSLSMGNISYNISSSDLVTSRGLVDSYMVILKTRETLEDVADYAEVNRSFAQLSGMVSAEAVNETEIFKVTVTSPDPKEAEQIADAISYILPKRISSIVEGTSAQIVDHAVLPTQKSSPNTMKNTMLGLILGFMASVGLICLYEIFNITIRSEEDVEQCCHYPVLAVVPDMRAGSKGGYYGYHQSEEANNGGRSTKKKALATSKKNLAPEKTNDLAFIGNNMGFSAAEAYKLLGTKVQFSFADEMDNHVISVSSSLPGEGKSLTSINLAHSLATLNKKVLLMDCDLRKPSMATKLGIQATPGLSNYLVRQNELTQVIQKLTLDGGVRIDVVTSGDVPPNAIELLSSERMARLMEELRKTYDVIVLDLPPIKEVSDAMVVSKISDGILMVTRENYCDRVLLGSSIKQFEFINAKILGVVLNCSREKDENKRKYGKYYGKYGKYGYRYGYGYGYRRHYRSYASAAKETEQKNG